jgi:hypothetical protein
MATAAATMASLQSVGNPIVYPYQLPADAVGYRKSEFAERQQRVP